MLHVHPVRLLLISSTAVVSLLLLIEWNQYSDSHKKQQSDLYAAAVLETAADAETVPRTAPKVSMSWMVAAARTARPSIVLGGDGVVSLVVSVRGKRGRPTPKFGQLARTATYGVVT